MDSGRDLRKVLIVAREEDFTRVLAVYLSDLGLRTWTASRWTDALERIGEVLPDVILLDPSMPTVQGETMLRILREEGQTMPVVVLSDRLEKARVEALRSLGASEFVEKTASFLPIAQAIAEVLPGWSAENASIITQEEFDHIVEQRLAGIAQEPQDEGLQDAGNSTPGLPRSPMAPAPSSSGDTPETAPTVGTRVSLPPAGNSSMMPEVNPTPLPPPPPPPAAVSREGSRHRRVRHRHGRRFSRGARTFIALLLVCLLAGAIYVGMTTGFSAWVKGEVKRPAVQE